jgi:sortase A
MIGAALGEPGNLMLAGHRTSWFRALVGIVQGDTIRLDWFDAQGRLHQRSYSVEVVLVLQPDDVVHLMPTAEDSLTLITCYPFGRNPRSPQRFVVRALPLRTETVAATTDTASYHAR